MKQNEVIARNLLIGAEFDKFVIEHPEVLNQIPDGAQLIETKKPIIYIKLNKLSPQRSRIKQVAIELAKVG